MSIVSSSQLNMSTSKFLQPINTQDSSLKRKRYIGDLDAYEENKRARTAPPSPPMASVFRRSSLSPTPPSTDRVTLITSPVVPLSPPQTTIAPVPSTPPNPTTLPSLTRLPSISVIKKQVAESPEFKYLKQNDRYGSSYHSLEYPDTCVNDEDWRVNLEVWIERNFPEKFNNLKNLLKFDKPGFDLLNDAILLSELKEQLDHERRFRKPLFTSKISKKMMSQKSTSNYGYYQRTVQSDYSDDESSMVPSTFKNASSSWYSSSHPQHSSPISQGANTHTSSSKPFESNYTYTSNDNSPTSPLSHLVNPSIDQSDRRLSLGSIKFDRQPKSPSSLIATPSQWTGHHKLKEPVIFETNAFIHTQNHKAPNHTYTIHHHNQTKRVCASCGSDQSPCWRPSWSTAAGQLCNSCGLRYKKTGARCTVDSCRRIPAKGEWTAMKSRGKVQISGQDGHMYMGYSCLHCGGAVEVKERSK